MRVSLTVVAFALLAVVACSDSDPEPTQEPTDTATAAPTATPTTEPTSRPTEPSEAAPVLRHTGISVDDRLTSTGAVEALLVTCTVENPTSEEATEEISAHVRFVQLNEQSRQVTVAAGQTEQVEFEFTPPTNYDFATEVPEVECR